MDSGASSEVSSPQPPSGMSANSVGMGQMSPRSSPSSRPSLVGSPQHQQNSGLDPSKGFDDQRSYIDDEDSRSPIASSAANMCMAAAGTPVTSSSHESLSGAAVVGSPSPPPPMLPLSLAASKASFGSLAGPGIPSMVPGIYKSLDQHHHRPSIYNSPPPSQTVQGPNAGGHATADMGANECKLIDYRGAKIAAFIVNGETLLCLPQAFELFLKHLVGGLHTVYTKLKRLEVTPIVCNVEQVRILRGLGAIQPGVNRCKLLSCKDFDLLYKDCTTASSRPGRPPKRASLLGMSPTHHTSDSAALLKAKKCRMDNGDFLGYENGHITAEFLRAAEQLEKNPLLANGYSHHAAAAAQVAAAAAHIGSLPFIPISSHHGGGMGHQGSNLLSPTSTMSNSSHHHHHLTGMLPRRTTDVSTTKEHRSFSGSIEGSVTSARSKEDRCDGSEKERLFNNSYDHHRMKESSYPNGSANGHSSVLNLSQNNRGGGIGDHSGSEGNFNEVGDDEDDDNDSEEEDEDDREHDLSDNPDVSSTGLLDKGSANGSNAGISITGALSADSLGISSIETLLRNIQGLLKVAADNARQQERQANYEKAELKMEVLREREMREGLEKQLVEEQRIRVLYQKRIKKEKRIKRRLQEELELENKRRVQYEEALRNTSSETLRIMNESLAHEIERDRNNSKPEQDRKLQESFYKTFTAA